MLNRVCASGFAFLAIAAALPGVAASAGASAGRAAIEQVKISPDGQTLAMVLTDGTAQSITLETAATHQTVRTIDPGGQKVRDLQWAGPNHLIITTSKTGYVIGVDSEFGEHLTAIDYNVETKKSQQLLRYGTEKRHVTLNTINKIPEIRTINGKYFVFAEGTSYVDTPSADGYYTNYAKDGTATLFKIELELDSASTQTLGFPQTREFAVSPQGATLAATEYDAAAKRWSLKLLSGKWREVDRKSAPAEKLDLLGLGRDGVSVLVGERAGGQYVLREVSPDGVWTEPLPPSTPGGLIFDPQTHKLIGEATGDGDARAFQFFDPQLQKIWRAIAAAYPGQRAAPVSLSDDLKTWVVLVESPTEGRAYALVDLTAKTADWIGNATNARTGP